MAIAATSGERRPDLIASLMDLRISHLRVFSEFSVWWARSLGLIDRSLVRYLESHIDTIPLGLTEITSGPVKACTHAVVYYDLLWQGRRDAIGENEFSSVAIT